MSLHQSLYRAMLANLPDPPLRDINGEPNKEWLTIAEAKQGRFVPMETLLVAIAEEDRVIDEMIGLRSPPQYPHPEDAERVLPLLTNGRYYRDSKTVEWYAGTLDRYFKWGETDGW